VPAVPDPSARSWVGRRGRRRRCPPVAPPNAIASTTPLIGRRQRLRSRRRRRAAAVVDNHASPGMPGVANERQSRLGPSPAAGPLPSLSSLRHGDGQAACADAWHRRRPSPSWTGPTVAAPPPEAPIAASRITRFGAESCSPVSAYPRGTARCHACRRCWIRRLDLGSGEGDGDADVRPSPRPIRSRRRRPWSVAVSDSVVDAAIPTPPSSRTVRPRGCPALPTRVHPFQGRHPSPCPRPRRRLHDQGTSGPRAPTPGTGVAPPPFQRGWPWPLCRPKHASLRAVLIPPGRSAGLQSAPALEGRLDATRAGSACSVGSILGLGKRTATQMSARRAAECDRVDDALDRSLSTTQSSMPPTRRHRRRFWGSRRLVVVIAAASLVSCVRPIICFLSLALRDTSRVLSCPVLVAT